jgi:hypothetical protein
LGGELEGKMSEGLFSPLHVVILLFSAAMVFGAPFLAGFFLGRYVEIKKMRRP